MYSKKGFTLIELALVLVIFGLLLASGIGIISILVKNQKFNETKGIVDKACKTLEGFAISHKKLPSDLNLLGIPTKDSFTNDIVYAFAPRMEGIDFCNTEPLHWLTLDDNGNTKKIAFIVYSKGANMHDETKTGTDSYQIKPYGADVGSYKYDDIVCFGDINLLREKGCEPFQIVTDSLPVAIQYLPYSTTVFKISGGTLSGCSISGNLPSGINFDSSSCSISGTPTQSGTFNFSITASDTIDRTTTKSFNLTVNPNPVKIATPYLPYGYKDNPYNVGLTAKGGTGKYSWNISGNFPSGISASSSIISGTPTETGTFSILVTVCDATFTSVCDSKKMVLSILDNTVSSGGSGGSGGSSGGSGSSIINIVNLFGDISFRINSTGSCVNVNRNTILTIDLSSVDPDNDEFIFYKNSNCDEQACTKVGNDFVAQDVNNNGIINLQKLDSGLCIFNDI